MKISYNWLQKYFDEKLPAPEKIAEGIIFHSFEVEEVEKIGEEDTIFDIKILPDRAHDCLCHFGIAKEVSAIFGIPLSSKNNLLKILKQDGQGSESENVKNKTDSEVLQIEVRSDNCLRYMGRIVKNVKVGPSPKWLSDALVSIGQKSINNIVDATNYVMFDLGNPIHAFDLDKLESPKIIVDKALNGEKFTLLDGRVVTLDESMLTIRDEKEALVIAGIKGGKKAEIDNNTKNIMIEVANFDAISTRKTAKKLGIFTDSAKRFENEIPARLASLSMEQITNLILEIAGGESFEVVDIYNNREKTRQVSFSENYVKSMLGIEIPTEEICNILNNFNYKFENHDGNFEVEIPFLRLDISGPYDMVEEIGRTYGYDKVVPVLPQPEIFIENSKINKIWVDINNAKNYLINDGYKEVLTYAFCDKGDVEVMASAMGKNFLRNNLSDGLKESIRLNTLNLSLLDMKEVKVFEVGTVFFNDKEEMHVAYGDKKEIVEMSLEKFIVSSEKLFERSSDEGDGSRCQTISNNFSDFTSISHPFKMWSLYPFISRDIAVWIPENEDKEKLKKIFIEEGTNLLVKEPYLFDSFTKKSKVEGEESKTSYAYRLVFQSYEKTLTDEEINPIMEKINSKITSFSWQVR